MTAKSLKTTSKTFDIEIRNELRKGSNGVVYQTFSDYFNGIFVLKTTKVKKGKKDINFYCRSIISSIEILTSFPNCSKYFLCTYGIIINESDKETIDPEILQILIENNLIFISDSIEPNIIYLLYEFINGETIGQKIKNAIERDEDIDYEVYMRNILENLIYLQERGFVHLDLKPENFMVDSNNNVVIIDTEFLCNQTRHEKCKMNAMTPNYVSLEGYDSMFSHKKYIGTDYLFKTDIFACGLVFYEMIMKRKSEHRIYDIFKKIEGPELDLPFTRNKAMWKPLIDGMTRRYYTERLNAIDALLLFESIHSSLMRNGGRKIRKKQDIPKNIEIKLCAKIKKQKNKKLFIVSYRLFHSYNIICIYYTILLRCPTRKSSIRSSSSFRYTPYFPLQNGRSTNISCTAKSPNTIHCRTITGIIINIH